MVISVKFGGTGYFETNQLLLATVHFSCPGSEALSG